jgi:iron(III) transport system permease protein
MKPSPTFRFTVLLLFAIIVLLPILLMLVLPLGSGSLPLLATLFEQRHLALARNSLMLAAGTTLLAVFIGVPFAFICQRTALPGRSLFQLLGIIPILIPPYIQAIAWTRLLDGLPESFSPDIHTVYGAIFVLTLSFFPFVTLLTISGLKSIGRESEESALLHHGPWRTITGITLPLCSPHIFCGALFVFIFTIVDFGVPDILRVKVYPVEIFIQFSAFYDEQAAAILSYPLILMTVIAVLMQKWYMGGRAFINLGDSGDRPPDYDLGKFRPAALGFCCAVIGLSVILPLFSLVKTAGSPAVYMRVLISSWEQIGFSLIIAVMGGMATILLAFPISHMIERSTQKHMGLLELASLVPFAIPAITLGIGIIKIWNRAGIDLIYNSIFIIVLAYVARFIPFAIRLTSAGLKKVNPGLEEAAELSTGNWIRVMRKIVLPCFVSGRVGYDLAGDPSRTGNAAVEDL